MSDDADKHAEAGGDEGGLVTGLAVIGIYVSDLSRGQAFYSDVLGFRKIQEMPPGVLMKTGDLTLYLEGGRSPDGIASLARPACSPTFATKSVRAARAALEARGVELVGELEQYGDEFAFFRFADPDGNVLELAGTP